MIVVFDRSDTNYVIVTLIAENYKTFDTRLGLVVN